MGSKDWAIAAAVTVALVGGTGCGDSADERGAATVALTYLKAIADGRGQDACDALSEQARRQTVAFLREHATGVCPMFCVRSG